MATSEELLEAAARDGSLDMYADSPQPHARQPN